MNCRVHSIPVILCTVCECTHRTEFICYVRMFYFSIRDLNDTTCVGNFIILVVNKWEISKILPVSFTSKGTNRIGWQKVFSIFFNLLSTNIKHRISTPRCYLIIPGIYFPKIIFQSNFDSISAHLNIKQRSHRQFHVTFRFINVSRLLQFLMKI